MSLSHRLLATPMVALAILAAVPAQAQEPPQRRPFQQQRPQQPQQQRPQQLQPRPQEAQRRHGGNGAGIAAGVIGGLAAGAILGGILSNRGQEVEGGPAVDPGCPLVRRPVYDAEGRPAGYQAVPSC